MAHLRCQLFLTDFLFECMSRRLQNTRDFALILQNAFIRERVRGWTVG